MFKIGQPKDVEFLSLAQDFGINWRSLVMMLGLTDLTLNESTRLIVKRRIKYRPCYYNFCFA